MSTLTLKELELLNTASAYNGEQHKAICGKAALELIEYKQNEEEWGIDFNTLFKILKNGIYAKTARGKIVYLTNGRIWLGSKDIMFLYYVYDYVRIKDYGKTWALTKEELL